MCFRYEDYVVRVGRANEKAKEQAQQDGTLADFVPIQVKPKTKNGAACINPEATLAEQQEMIDMELANGALVTSCSTVKPRLNKGLVEWITVEYMLAEGHCSAGGTLHVCWQAAMVAFTSCTAEALGKNASSPQSHTCMASHCLTHEPAGMEWIPKPETFSSSKRRDLLGFATFSQIGEALSLCSGLGTAFFLRTPFTQFACVYDIFRVRYGTFCLCTNHFHAEDMEVAGRKDTERIPHLIVWNATNRLLQLYPEVRANRYTCAPRLQTV